ncbi:MAG: LptF/LptG family permease [Elusimicrobiota bacterium]|nr:LptF/LptG family permease [Elusimicrobiota bacterium]
MKLVKKYILKSFIKPFAGGLAAFLFIMTVAHFFDFLHTFLKYKPPLEILIKYFLFRMPAWFTTITPIATLIAVLISLGSLEKNNEITAVKTSGIKLIRVIIPLFILSVFISMGSGIINETIVPHSEPAANILFERIKEKAPLKPDETRRDIIYMGESSTLYFIDHFKKNTLTGLRIIEFYPGTALEKKLIVAEKAHYLGSNSWDLVNGSIRTFNNNISDPLTGYEDFNRRQISLAEVPADFSKPHKEPEQMSLPALADYIRKLKQSGMSTRRERVLFHYKIAFPFASAIILVLGIPLALYKKIDSLTISFFFAIIISFLYWGGISVGRSMGINGILPPVLAAWSANIIFFLVGMVMMIKTRII